jgi:hypothetical protein
MLNAYHLKVGVLDPSFGNKIHFLSLNSLSWHLSPLYVKRVRVISPYIRLKKGDFLSEPKPPLSREVPDRAEGLLERGA